GLQKFETRIPKDPNDNYSLAKVTVTYTGKTTFARILGISSFNTRATATAAHRPRDVAIILDFSGSMRFSSLVGLPYYGSRAGSNTPEGVFPLFGHYSAQATAALQSTTPKTDSGGNAFDPCNATEADSYNSQRPPIVQDFYQKVTGNPQPAFSPSPSSY